MRATPTLSWQLDGDPPVPFDGRLLPLLEAVAATSSLSAAAGTCGVSYRAAWGLLRDYQRMLGTPLVQMERGRGARLTPQGERLLDAQRAARSRFARAFSALAVDLGGRDRDVDDASMACLRVAASHDLALAAL